jgi:hypothetical protein
MKFLRPMLAGALALAGLAVGAGSAQANCYRGNCWGAVAYGPHGASYAVNFPNRQAAQQAALNSGSCVGGRCTSTLTFHNTCGALASAPNGGWGWGTDARGGQFAQQRAMYECQSRNHGCTIRAWGCTTR